MIINLFIVISVISLILYLYSYFNIKKLNYIGLHVLVTGGSSGIGLEVAKEYLRRGANVTIVARNKNNLTKALIELNNLIKTLKYNNQRTNIVSVDISSSEKEVIEAFQPVINEFGTVDVLINCAGTSIAGEFSSLNADEFSRMLKINVLGSVYPTRAVVEGMKLKKAGRIVFVSSQVAQVAIYGYTAYGASKWALRGLAEALQMELRPYGNIYVSIAYPPDTDTPGYEIEMQSKPDITKKLSESGAVFSSKDVAYNIVEYSDRGYYGIGSGIDGWMLKNLHPGMSPINNLWEVWTGILFAPLCRFISIFYLFHFDSVCKSLLNKSNNNNNNNNDHDSKHNEKKKK